MATLQDVAKKASVSVSTASHVLSGKGDERRISPETQERVRRIAQMLNYTPNIAARQLRNSNRVPRFTLLLKTGISSNTLGEIVKLMQYEQNRSLEQFTLDVVSYISDDLERLRDILTNINSNGIIVAGITTEEEIRFLESMDLIVPLVLFNAVSEKHNCVYIDFRAVGGQAAELLHMKGHKRVAFVTFTDNVIHKTERTNTFLTRCREMGMEIDTYNSSDIENSLQSGYDMTMQMLCNTPKVSAVFYNYGELAIGGLRACSDCGVRVPEDLEVLAYGEDTYHDFLVPSLSSAKYPIREMITSCIRMLLDAYYRNELTYKTIKFEAQFNFRESFTL